jgi:hypothetical protein
MRPPAHLRWLLLYLLAGALGTLLVLGVRHLLDDHAALHILAAREGQRIAAESKAK